jgi:glycine hydroxymethyltransferase
MVPFDTESPFVTSGIRVGTAAITSRGLVAADMAFITEQIDRVLQAPEDEAVIAKVRQEIHAKMKSYPLHQEMVMA